MMIVKKTLSKPANAQTKEFSLQEVHDLIEQHKLHLKFLQDNNNCDSIEKGEVIKCIEDVFEVSRSRTGSKCNNMDSVSN